MYRIFKKKHDRSARATEARARRPRRQRPGLEALETRQLLSLGDPFQVNTKTQFAQNSSDNASAANGLGVVVWQDQFATDHVDNDIRAQMYDANGAKRGGELTIEFSGANEVNPHVAMDAVGNFVVTYEETNNGQRDIIGRRVTLDSQGLPHVGNRLAVALSSLNEHDADVAMDASGNFVVSYTADVSAGNKDIFATRFNSSNAETSFFGVSQSTDFDETLSSVAMSPNGRFDIAYQFEGTVRVSTYTAGGTRIADQMAFSQRGGANPSIAMDNAGNAVVAFQTIPFGGPGGPGIFEIQAQRVNTGGAVGGGGFVSFGSHATSPSVALSATGGSYVVAYDVDRQDDPGHLTVGVTEVSGSDKVVFSKNVPAFPDNFAPAVSIDGNNNYTLSFTAGNVKDIYAAFGRMAQGTAPQAQNLALTPSIQAGQSATVSGQLVDADGDTTLTLTVDWGDGSDPEQSQPGTNPFAVKHKYHHAGTYSVRVTWTDSTGLFNSRDLKLEVTKKAR